MPRKLENIKKPTIPDRKIINPSTGKEITDLSGVRSGKLSVVSLSEKRSGKAMYWNCICDCGERCLVRSIKIVSGWTTSCGCIQFDAESREAARVKATKHGGSYTKEYRTWDAMRRRCNDPKHPQYPDYGGRGIKVCQEWGKFENFIAAMGAAPKGMSIDRINNDGNYEPANCRWATKMTQANNKRNTTYVKYKGRMVPVAELARIGGMNRTAVKQRIAYGWSAEDAISTPIRQHRPKRSIQQAHESTLGSG